VPTPSRNTAGRELTCPYCGARIWVADNELTDGGTVKCGGCNSQSMLTREWLGHSVGYHWGLVEAGDDDEP
jgi:predicted Zn finger-like uncharacterized protein